MLVERASAIIAERGNARGRATMFLRADREGDIDRGLVRSGRDKDTDRKRERGREKKDVERERERERERRTEKGSDRRGTASASLKNASPGSSSGTGSIQSSQVSPRGDNILLRGVRSAFFFFRGLTLRSSRPLRARLFLSIPILFSRCQTFLAHEIYFHPPITPTPKGTRARAQTRCVELVRSLHHQRIRMSVVSRSRELPHDFCKR